MIPVSDGFRAELEKDNRAYQTVINMALKDGTALSFTNAQLWQGSVYIEDAVSPDDTFDVGCAIINKLVFGVNNINDVYTHYDFEGAVAEIRVGLLVNGTLELVRKGIFTLDDAKFDGSIINFTMLDYMERFDRQYKTNIKFPATLKQIVSDMCATLRVTLATKAFPNCDYVVSKKPEDTNLTYREVLSWCAAIAGSFARVNRDGQLEIKWYDFDALADSAPPTELDGGIFDDTEDTYYASGDSADGGDFTFSDYDDKAGIISGGTFSWNENVHEIKYLYSEDVALKATSPTGVRIIYEVTKKDKTIEVKTLTKGTDKFLVTVADNDFIASDAQAQAVADSLYERMAFVYFHEAVASAVSDPTIEAGDVGYIRDFRGKYYPIIFSRTKFSTYKSQTISSNAETASKNSSYQGFTGGDIDINTRINDINLDLDTKVGDGWNFITGVDGIDYTWTIDNGQIVIKPLPKKMTWGNPPHAYVYPGQPLNYEGVTTFLDQEEVTDISVFDPEDGFVIPDALTVGSTFWVSATVKKYGKEYWVDKLVTVQPNPLMSLGDIMSDFSAHYGDPEGALYGWYVRFADDSQAVNFYDAAGNKLSVQIFCDRHIPQTPEYYEKDANKPVGIQDRGEVAPLDDTEHPGERRARNIWYIGDTNYRINRSYGGGTQGISPYWHQGTYGSDMSSAEKYWHPGDGLIWSGWKWWLYESDVIYRWNFDKKTLGSKMFGSALFYAG